MPDEKKEIPSIPEKGESVEKSHHSGKLNENSMPDFQYTPTPPPPPPPSKDEKRD